MEPFNLFKGYSKVAQLELDHHQNTTSTRKPIVAAVIAILLLTLVISLMVAALINETNSEESQSLLHNSTQSIQLICSVTQNPESCFTTISTASLANGCLKPDPVSMVKLSLQISSIELRKLTPVFRSVNDLDSEAAIRDCESQLDDSLSRLNDSLSAMEETLTEEKINDIQTWISSALTDQETCIDGLAEMGSKVVDEVKAKMVKSTEMLSISLAIVANIKMLIEKFDLD